MRNKTHGATHLCKRSSEMRCVGISLLPYSCCSLLSHCPALCELTPRRDATLAIMEVFAAEIDSLAIGCAKFQVRPCQ